MYLSTKHVFEQQLVRIIGDEIKRLQDVLTGGSAHSYEEYKFIVGRISGLRAALEYVEEANASIERGV